MKNEKEKDRSEPITLDDKNSIALRVSDEEFIDFSNGEKCVVSINVNQDTFESVLENIQGNLVLCCDEMPVYYYSCYFWNNGVFPYVVKNDLQYIILLNRGREIILRITGHSASVLQRYTIIDNEYLEPDENGDACEWTIHFKVEKCFNASFVSRNSTGEKSKTYLLRWNPTISSFRLDDYREASTQCPNGFHMNWSIYEWENAHEGDRFYMLRTGDEYAGIVFCGIFTSEPYPGDDWAGRGKQRYYIDIDCFGCESPGQKPSLDVETLEHSLPNIDWRRGHSGELLSEVDAEKLYELWNGF